VADYTAPEYKEWQAPPAAVDESRKIGFLNESVEEGSAWLRSQRGYSDFRKALDVLSGQDSQSPRTPAYRSHLNTNRLKRNVKEVVGTLAKLRPMWGYHSDNAAYKPQAEMFNKVAKAWYLETGADRAVREALQYAAATCRGWVHPQYRRDMYGTGHGDIKLFTYGAPCVLPNQLPANGDFQSAYIVHILEEMPVAMAHGMFPAFQHRLRPSSSRYWYANDGIHAATVGNASGGGVMQRIFGRGSRRNASDAVADLLIPIRKSYVIDLTINTTKAAIPMGEPGSSWSYMVPFLGQDLPAGNDPKSGAPLFRKATETDARLYPYRRLILSTDTVCLYDGPAFDWHGMFPAISFCMDDWPWEPLGFSLVHEGFELNEAIKEIVRGNMDKIRSQLRPSLAYDQNAVSMSEARALDPMQPDKRIGYDGTALEGAPFTPILDAEFLKVNPESMTMVEYLENAMDSQLAVRDAMALAKMRSVGSMDELEKVVEANGPIIEDISRTMEPPMRDLGIMVKYLVMQYYTTARVMQVVGADSVTPEVFDYDPSSLVPSHAPGEDPSKGLSAMSARERAKVFADNLRFFILPNSLHEMSQMVMKLGLIQLKKAGVKIDSQTIAESWNIPNYGTIDGSTVMERFKNEQEMDLAFAAKMKELAGALGLLPQGPPGAGGPGAQPEGRPNANTAPPALKSKDNGARSTITTSK
jgi:hypothetical protein